MYFHWFCFVSLKIFPIEKGGERCSAHIKPQDLRQRKGAGERELIPRSAWLLIGLLQMLPRQKVLNVARWSIHKFRGVRDTIANDIVLHLRPVLLPLDTHSYLTSASQPSLFWSLLPVLQDPLCSPRWLLRLLSLWFFLFVCFHVWFWPNALAEWRTELLYALIGAPFHSLMNVSNCFSLRQHYFQSTGGKVKSGKEEKQSMLHKGRAAQVELSAVGLCTSSEDKASHLEVFFHLLEWNYLSRLAQGSLQGNLSWGAVI